MNRKQNCNFLKIKNTINMKKTFFNLVLATVVLASCSKATNSSEVASSDDNSTAEDLFMEVYESSLSEADLMDATISGSRSITEEDLSKVVTDSIIDSATHHIIRTITFTNHSVERNGVTRTKNGKIIIDKTGRRHENGFLLDVSFEDFSINDYQIEGSKQVSSSLNGDTLSTSIQVTSTITSPEGSQMSWNKSRTRTFLEGGSTKDRADDVIQIEGSSSGTNFDGESFSATITTPLIKESGCFYISEGVIEISPVGKSSRILDYGSRETCDNIATVTVDGESKEIEIDNLRKKRRRRFRRR